MTFDVRLIRVIGSRDTHNGDPVLLFNKAQLRIIA